MTTFAASTVTAAQRLAQSLLNAWSVGDHEGVAAMLRRAPQAEPDDDVMDLVRAIGAKLAEPLDAEETRASVKLLSHLARPRF
ncbi:MAG: hypothetical protein LAO79_09140 [Acidobacteriia bacterium]|nr:hypothetical protein [Terriglobia bacterium]